LRAIGTIVEVSPDTSRRAPAAIVSVASFCVVFG
jgi:hypothetical protein